MKLEDSSGDSMSSDGGDSPVEIFWQRYRRLVLRAGGEEGVAVWYRRHVEGFIRFIKPRRLRQANVADVSQYLLKMHRGEDTEAWQVRQADKALRLMYQELLNEEWAGEWAVPLPLPMEEVAESVPSAELGKKAVFAEWGQWEGSLERVGVLFPGGITAEVWRVGGFRAGKAVAEIAGGADAGGGAPGVGSDGRPVSVDGA